MTALAPADVVDAMHAAFRRSDLDAIARHWADDVRYQAPGVELVGMAARRVAEQVWLGAFSDNDVWTTHRFVSGEDIVDFAVMTAVHSGDLRLPGGDVLPPTGRRMRGSYVARYRIVGGKVASQEVVYDRLALLQQLQADAAA